MLAHALIQGTGFAGLMTVLGLLRHPVRRSRLVRAAAQELLSRPPRNRFFATYLGSHCLSLLFNVGIIPMIGDLTRQHSADDPQRPALVLAAQRGAATMAMWSPMGLGFAIIMAGIPGIPVVPFIALTAGFTALLLVITGLHPMLPPELSPELPDKTSAESPATGGHPAADQHSRALWLTFGLCAALMALVLIAGRVTGLSFTLASVAVLPLVAIAWLLIERGEASFGTELRASLAGLPGLRNESTVFLSANAIGAGISLALSVTPLHDWLASGMVPFLPLLLMTLVLVPLCAAACVPNAILLVLVAQTVGNTPLGAAHPLSLGLALALSWGPAVSVAPISAMCLLTGTACDVPPRRVGHYWNLRFAVFVTLSAAVLVSVVYASGK